MALDPTDQEMKLRHGPPDSLNCHRVTLRRSVHGREGQTSRQDKPTEQETPKPKPKDGFFCVAHVGGPRGVPRTSDEHDEYRVYLDVQRAVACGGQVVDAGRAVDDRRLGRQPLVAVGSVRAASGAGAPCAGTAGAGGVCRAARSTPMTAPMSHSAKATDAMPPLQMPDRHSTATA